MENICLDTDVLVDFLRNKPEAVRFLEAHELKDHLAMTYISLFELYYGAMKSTSSDHNVKAVELLSQRLSLLNLSPFSVKEAGKLLANLEKKGEVIDFRDLLIGTIALTQGFTLKTNNHRHFRRIPH